MAGGDVVSERALRGEGVRVKAGRCRIEAPGRMLAKRNQLELLDRTGKLAVAVEEIRQVTVQSGKALNALDSWELSGLLIRLEVPKSQCFMQKLLVSTQGNKGLTEVPCCSRAMPRS